MIDPPDQSMIPTISRHHRQSWSKATTIAKWTAVPKGAAAGLSEVRALRNRGRVVRSDLPTTSAMPSFQIGSHLPKSGTDRGILPPAGFCRRRKFPRNIGSAPGFGALLPREGGVRQMIHTSERAFLTQLERSPKPPLHHFAAQISPSSRLRALDHQ
jgi:hypothetical protein